MVLAKALALRRRIGVVLPTDDGQQALAVQVSGAIEARLHHRVIDGVFALCEGVEGVADGHHAAGLEVRQVRDEQLHQDSDRGALALEALGERDERFDERRREWVDLLEVGLVALAADQHVLRLARGAPGLGEVVREPLRCRLILRAHDAVGDDRRKVRIGELDDLEAPLVVRHVSLRLSAQRARGVLAEELADVALTRHEAHDRNGPVGVLRFLELHHLLRLATDEAGHARVACQPEHQLVEVEHDGVEAERLGVATHDAKTRVQVHEATLLRRPRLVEGANEIAEQLGARARGVAVGLADVGRSGRGLKGGGVPLPRLRELAPAARRLLHAAVQLLEELVVAHPAPQVARVVEEAVVGVESGRRRLGMRFCHPRDIRAQDLRLHVLCAEHVDRELEELLPADPVVLAAKRVAFTATPRGRGVGQREVQHRPEVAGARAGGSLE
ncbi:MAG: hypothetical protein ACK6CU_05695, partial [Deltaproteobacteria bacterium]